MYTTPISETPKDGRLVTWPERPTSYALNGLLFGFDL